MVTWSHGHMVTWSHGHMVTWSHGHMVTWSHGHMVKSEGLGCRAPGLGSPGSFKIRVKSRQRPPCLRNNSTVHPPRAPLLGLDARHLDSHADIHCCPIIIYVAKFSGKKLTLTP